MKRTLASIALSLLAGHAVAQNTIVVPDDVPTLTLALNPSVSGLAPGDTIELTTGATYFDRYTVVVPNITIRAAAGQAIELNPFNTGTALTVSVGPFGSFTLEGITIRNGGTPAGVGGAVRINSAGTVNAVDCTFVENLGNIGAGISSFNGDLSLTRCRFIDNEVRESGGGLYMSGGGDLVITECVFEGNRASDSSAEGQGVAFYQTNGSLRMSGSTFTENFCAPPNLGSAVLLQTLSGVLIDTTVFVDNLSPSRAGAIEIGSTPNLVIRDCVFERNQSGDRGGALRFNQSVGTIADCRFIMNEATAAGAISLSGAGTSLDVLNSVFEGNSGRFNGGSGTGGGAIQVDASAALEVYNSLFTGNTATTGGGISVFNAGTLKVINSTFYDNDADIHGGAIRRSTIDSAVRVSNSIFTANFPPNAQVTIGTTGAVTDVSSSLVEGGYPGPGSNNIDADPLFADADGGDFRLLPGSPAIDAASIGLYGVGPYIDIAGFPRVVDDPETADTGFADYGPMIDMGAYEFQSAGPADTCPTDANGDGVINFADLNAVLGVFGTACR